MSQRLRWSDIAREESPAITPLGVSREEGPFMRLLDYLGDSPEWPTPEDMEAMRPRSRADCLPGGKNEMRPCPWVSCRHHLGLDLQGQRSAAPTIKVSDADVECHHCVLDIVDAHGSIDPVTIDTVVGRVHWSSVEISKAIQRVRRLWGEEAEGLRSFSDDPDAWKQMGRISSYDG